MVMKKFLGMVALVAAATLVSNCGNGGFDTPTDVAKKGAECLKAKNWEGYVDLLYFSDAIKKEDVEKTKQQYLDLLKGKMGETLEKVNGIKDYEVLSEEIKDSTAVVKMKVTFGDDSTKEEDIKARLNKDGNWLLDTGK